MYLSLRRSRDVERRDTVLRRDRGPQPVLDLGDFCAKHVVEKECYSMRAQSSMELNRWVLHFRALRREEAEKLNTEIAPNPFNEALALAGLANRDGYSGSASATAPAFPETAAAEHTRRYRVEQRGRTLQKSE